MLDLIDMEKSHCYNPFVYINSDDDIQRLTTNLFKNTTPKGSQTQDPFWDQTAAMLLKALVCYLHYEAPPDEQNFSMVMEMIRAGDIKEDNEEYQSVLDELFERLEERNPEHIALKYYRAYYSGSAKTLKSIQISLVSRLEKFNLDSLAGITQCDEMDLGQIGEKKTAVFAVIPDNDSSFNFIVGMLYTQLFQQLYYQADSVHGGRLPVHVHFVMDEFANVALPDEFDKLLSTMRSREISVSIIVQNLAQLKALFEKQWESIVGNCDEFLYLGGNEQSTYEYVFNILVTLIEQGYRYFGAGGALGFDTLAAQAVLRLRERYPQIRLILVLPCLNQTRGWPQADIDTYEEIKRCADKVTYTSEHYFRGCMQKRNRHLVDNSSACICYLTKPTGGTAYTVDYARRMGLRIINVTGLGSL
mgnify:CR=1 FL=1